MSYVLHDKEAKKEDEVRTVGYDKLDLLNLDAAVNDIQMLITELATTIEIANNEDKNGLWSDDFGWYVRSMLNPTENLVNDLMLEMKHLRKKLDSQSSKYN